MSTTDPKATVLGDDLVDGVQNTIDFGYNISTPDYSNISYSSGVDTITLDPSWTTTSITMPSTYATSTIGTSTGTYTIGSYAAPISNVNITGNGIDMANGTDIKIDGKSLKNFMDKMEERLAILVPDPAKLEKFEALKKAYEHYKLMEQLCQETKVET
jgi:hypothetical protein